MWTAVAVILALAGQGFGFWTVSDDPSMGNLGFYIRTMDCDKKAERCVHCFQEKSGGEVYMHTFEFVSDPVKYEVNMFMGKLDRKLYIMRNNTEKIFRMCFEHNWTPKGQDDFKVDICVDNNFTEMPKEEECDKPVALVTFDYHHSDDKIHGQQILYCIPSVGGAVASQQ